MVLDATHRPSLRISLMPQYGFCPAIKGPLIERKAVLKSPLTKRYQSLRQDYHCWLSRIKWTSGERQYILTFCKNILKPDFWLKSDIETPYKSILQFKDQNTPCTCRTPWWRHVTFAHALMNMQYLGLLLTTQDVATPPEGKVWLRKIATFQSLT